MNPLTGLYAAGTSLRNTLFDRGTLRSRRLNRPVISVGNLSVGGSGKTPFVIELGTLLQQRGLSIDVLSRGYGRRTRGVRVVEPGGGAADYGDEPLLIARRLGVPAIVGESRYEAGRLAEATFPSQVHLLDDGFQHRSLARDFDIVLLSPGDLEDRLLPSGRLREPLSSLRRADAIIVPHGFAADHPPLQGKPAWQIQRAIEFTGQPQSPLVFCGIAKPQQFFAQVRAAGVTPATEIEFPDHHAYGRNDIEKLLDIQRRHSAGGYLTTEKDLVNLGEYRQALNPLSVAVLRVTIERSTDLVDTILARIAGQMPRS